MANPIRWDQVAAPNFSGVTDALRLSGQSLDAASRDLLVGLQGWQQGQQQARIEDTNAQTSELMRRASQYVDPQELQAALADGRLVEGLNVERINPDAFNSLSSRVSTLQKQRDEQNTFDTAKATAANEARVGPLKVAYTEALLSGDPLQIARSRAAYLDASKTVGGKMRDGMLSDVTSLDSTVLGLNTAHRTEAAAVQSAADKQAVDTVWASMRSQGVDNRASGQLYLEAVRSRMTPAAFNALAAEVDKLPAPPGEMFSDGSMSGGAPGAPGAGGGKGAPAGNVGGPSGFITFNDPGVSGRNLNQIAGAVSNQGLYSGAPGTREGSRYDAVIGFGKYGAPGRPVTQMTAQEYLDYAPQLIEASKNDFKDEKTGLSGSSAFGPYQITARTLKDAMQRFGIPGDTPLTPQVQEAIAQRLYEETPKTHAGMSGRWQGLTKDPASKSNPDYWKNVPWEVARERIANAEVGGLDVAPATNSKQGFRQLTNSDLTSTINSLLQDVTARQRSNEGANKEFADSYGGKMTMDQAVQAVTDSRPGMQKQLVADAMAKVRAAAPQGTNYSPSQLAAVLTNSLDSGTAVVGGMFSSLNNVTGRGAIVLNEDKLKDNFARLRDAEKTYAANTEIDNEKANITALFQQAAKARQDLQYAREKPQPQELVNQLLRKAEKATDALYDARQRIMQRKDKLFPEKNPQSTERRAVASLDRQVEENLRKFPPTPF